MQVKWTSKMMPTLRKSKPSYSGALYPSVRTQHSYNEARRVGPKGTEKYDGALRAEISSATTRGLDIQDIQSHLRSPHDFGRVSMLIDASIRDGTAGQIEHRTRALIAYFSRILPTITHPRRKSYLQYIILGLKMKNGTNAQKAEAERRLA